MTTEHSPNAVALEVTSALLVPAAAFGFIRVFAEAGAVVPILVAAVLSTALATPATYAVRLATSPRPLPMRRDS